MGEQETRQRSIVLRRADQIVAVQRLFQGVQIRSTFHQQAIAFSDNVRRFVLVRKLSGDRFQHVQRCNQPLYHAEFIGHYHQAAFGTT